MIARGAIALAVACLALVDASEARVILAPTIPNACPDANRWAKLEACLARHGTVRVVERRRDLQLVQLEHDPKKTRGFRIPGLYLYTKQNGRWRLGGMLQREDVRVRGVHHVVQGRAAGYRIDLVASRTESVAVDDRVHAALVREQLALYCSGQTPGCSVAISACDVYVNGKVYWTFRGELELRENVVEIRGDRSKAGVRCAPSARVFVPLASSD